MTDEQVLRLLRDSGALLEGHFRLSSGLHSSGYLQCAVALQHPRLAERLGNGLAARWMSLDVSAPRVVVSPALGGVIIGHEVARALADGAEETGGDVRACFTEREEGVMTLRRGFRLSPDEAVLVVEDVITTGRSTRETLDVVRSTSARPIGVACIADRAGLDQLDGLPLVALVGLDIPTYDPDDCPLCAAGLPIVKLGSRPG